MTIEREKSEIRNTLIFHLWVFHVLVCTELIQPDFTSKPCFSLKAMDQHKPSHFFSVSEPKNLKQLPFQPLVFQNLDKRAWVEISLSFDLGVLDSWYYMKSFCLDPCLSVSDFFFFKLIITLNLYYLT